MCRLLFLVLLAGCFLPVLARAGEKATSEKPGLDGHWLGKLKVGVVELRLGLNFSRDKEGKLTGTLDSPDQGAKNIPVEEIQVKEQDVELHWPSLKAAFEGKFQEKQQKLVGQWKQAGLKLDMTFERLKEKPSYARPQDPKQPYPYRVEEVTFENRPAKVTFAATLTLPRGAGPFPAVVLLSGSGPQDRDETLLGHRPFLVLADHLTRRGIAVLRYDDRGVGKSTGSTRAATMQDHATDALAAIAFLQGRPEIQADKIGLLGHSEGGVVAPLAASQSKEVAFVIMLAGTGLPGEELMYLQGQALVKSVGGSAEDLTRTRNTQELMFTIVRKEKDDAAAEKQIYQQLAEIKKKLSAEEQKIFEEQQAVLENQIKMVLTPWFRHFLQYDPRPALRQLRVPVLVLNGELDVQVPPGENLREIAKALKEGGNKDVTIKEMPRLNHLFQTAKTGAVSEYGSIEETIAPAVLDLMADWIRERTLSRAQK
jgi:pimeloyl-ACP methyl ester carboxylesterase